MKIFVCEFVTGGGLYREDLPPSLLQEGAMMLQALVEELAELPGLSLITTHDFRIAPHPCMQSYQVTQYDDVWDIWERCIQEADAVWPIAPETDDILGRLCERVTVHGKRLIASDLATVRLAASKYQTALRLRASGIAVAPTFPVEQAGNLGGWPQVVKPDDGVSCDGVSILADQRDWAEWSTAHPDKRGWVIQPFIEGIPASISMLCLNGQAWLLSCNRQLIEPSGRGFAYQGGILNGMADHWSSFEALAQQVAQAMPGLAGYVGIDLMIHEASLLVMEVNPRLTTSYAGLSEAIGSNPASLILDLFYNGPFSSPPHIERNIVELLLNEQ